jgi:hypothetical protein
VLQEVQGVLLVKLMVALMLVELLAL